MITPDIIINKVNDYFNTDLIKNSKKQTQIHTYYRSVFFKIAREFLIDNTYETLGSILGKHHVTAMYSISPIKNRVCTFSIIERYEPKILMGYCAIRNHFLQNDYLDPITEYEQKRKEILKLSQEAEKLKQYITTDIADAIDLKIASEVEVVC